MDKKRGQGGHGKRSMGCRIERITGILSSGTKNTPLTTKEDGRDRCPWCQPIKNEPLRGIPRTTNKTSPLLCGGETGSAACGAEKKGQRCNLCGPRKCKRGGGRFFANAKGASQAKLPECLRRQTPWGGIKPMQWGGGGKPSGILSWGQFYSKK